MPANLTPEYRKAERVYREAKTAEEKIAALEHMLAVMPKHKGTDHLQADLRRRLSKLRDEAEKPKGKKGFNLFRVERGGAGQVVLLGPPNAGKSALVDRMTKARPQVAEYPYTTQAPMPGMMPFEDIQIQLVDLPAITTDGAPPGMMGLVKGADAALLLVDLSAPDVLEQAEGIIETALRSRTRLYEPEFPLPDEVATCDLRCLLVGNKIDAPGAEEHLSILSDLYRGRFNPIPVSVTRGGGLETLRRGVYHLLDIIRVYSKVPGKPADRSTPFTLKRGSTVLDVARAVHRDFPGHLQFAKIWGSARFDGQVVERSHVLENGDIVELHVGI